MPLRTLTAANAVIILSAPDVIASGIQLQGFAADDVFDTDDLEIVEAVMGVDGHLSGGYTPKPVPQRFTLQADSLSIDFFETFYSQSVQQQATFYLSGIVRLVSTGKSYAMNNGLLTRYKPLPDAKRILQSRTFGITWESVLPAPI